MKHLSRWLAVGLPLILAISLGLITSSSLQKAGDEALGSRNTATIRLRLSAEFNAIMTSISNGSRL